MILKRWMLNLISVMLGCWIGLLLINYLLTKMVVPSLVQLLIVILSFTLSFVASYGLGLRWFPPSEDEMIRPEIPRQPWAWLRPRGEGLRSGFPLNKSHVVIGRDVRCDVMVNHHSVSRRHAEVVRLAEGYLFRDMGSKNGCFVNGQRVQEYLLQEGDVIAVGDVQLNFEAPRRTEAPVLQEAEHLSVSQLLSPEALPLEGGEMLGSAALPDSEEGTEVWRRPE
ncbi:FHA domain-containing protein [bacterium]|nr:FHA domain-containing protein [bacterium]